MTRFSCNDGATRVGRSWCLPSVLSIVLSLVCGSARAQTPPAFRNLPSVAEVKQKVSGRDALDTEARLNAAFTQLIHVARTLSANGAYGSGDLSPAERAFVTLYGQAEHEALERGRALLAADGAPKTGPESPGPKFTRLAEHYHPDSLSPWILDEFPKARDDYEARRGSDQGTWDRATRVVAGGAKGAIADMLRTLALPMAIAFALLLFLLYPVVRFKTYPGTGGALPISGFRAGNGRYRLSAFSGVVEGTSRRATETTHTTRDEQGALLDSYTVTTVYDGLVLVDAQGNTRAFEVADFHVVTRPGHSVTVVSAARGRGGEELFVAVLDRTTRTGYFRYQSWGLFLGPGRMLGSMFLACVVGVPLAFGTAGVGLAIPFIAAVVMRIFTKRNIKRFRKQLMATT